MQILDEYDGRLAPERDENSREQLITGQCGIDLELGRDLDHWAERPRRRRPVTHPSDDGNRHLSQES